MAFLAISGGSLILYTTARAESLGIALGKPTLASKGTRTSRDSALAGWASFLLAACSALGAPTYLCSTSKHQRLQGAFFSLTDTRTLYKIPG